MKTLFIALVVVLPYCTFSQDTIISYYPSGKTHIIEYRGEAMKKRREQFLPIRINLNEDSTRNCETYLIDWKTHRVWYSTEEANVPVFGMSNHCSTYEYENGTMVSKTSRNHKTKYKGECPNPPVLQYSVEKGTFKRFILHNGTISYYTPRNELTATVTVKNGRRSNDPIVYFKDSLLFRQIRNMPNRVDLNGNHHIEVSEASCVEHLKIEKNVESFTGLAYFKNLKTIRYRGRLLQVSDFDSHQKLVEKLNSITKIPEPTPWADLRPITVLPQGCNCAMSDDMPKVTPGKIVQFADKDAEFPGGHKALHMWMYENLKTPEEDPYTLGPYKVYLSFVVELDGSITNVKVEKGFSRPFDLEAIRAVRSMPNWIPGEVQGCPVRQKVMLPIIFTLQ